MLTRCVDHRMTEIFELANLKHLTIPGRGEMVPFNSHRPLIWAAMKKLYPTLTDVSKLMGVKMKDDEEPEAYIERLTKLWREQMDEPWDTSSPTRLLFWQLILKGLPAPVKDRLEEELGLADEKWEKQRAMVVHHIRRYVDKKKKEEGEITKLQKKMIALQIANLEKDKDRVTEAAVITQQVQPSPQVQQPASPLQQIPYQTPQQTPIASQG